MRAAFFDRDGTINVNFGHVYRPKDLVFVPGIPEVIAEYNRQGIPVIVVTNQAGIAKGLYTEKEMHQFHAHMDQRLREEFDAHIDAFIFVRIIRIIRDPVPAENQSPGCSYKLRETGMWICNSP